MFIFFSFFDTFHVHSAKMKFEPYAFLSGPSYLIIHLECRWFTYCLVHYLVWLCQKISTSYFRTDTYAIYIIYMRYLKQSLSNLGKHEDQAFECNKIYAKHAHSNGTIRTVCSSKIQQQNPILRPSLRQQIQTFTHIFI